MADTPWTVQWVYYEKVCAGWRYLGSLHSLIAVEIGDLGFRSEYPGKCIYRFARNLETKQWDSGPIMVR